MRGPGLLCRFGRASGSRFTKPFARPAPCEAALLTEFYKWAGDSEIDIKEALKLRDRDAGRTGQREPLKKESLPKQSADLAALYDPETAEIKPALGKVGEKGKKVSRCGFLDS